MSGNFPVRHVRGFSLKWNQVQKGFRRGTLTWDDEAHTVIRDCTAVEQAAFYAGIAKEHEPFEKAEVPGLSFDHAGAPQEKRLAWEANRFALLQRILAHLRRIDRSAAEFFERFAAEVIA